MSDGRKKDSKHSKSHFFGDNVLFEYTVRPFVYVCIALAVAVIIAFVTIKPIALAVHKIEAVYGYTSRDVIVDEDMLYNCDEAVAGQKLASLTIENAGVNTPVFKSINFASARQGVGAYSEGEYFSKGGKTFVGGYDETYFNSLKTVKKGDIITVRTSDKLISFKVKSTRFDKMSWRESESENDLVLFSVFSGFSEHGDEKLYVFADLVSEEVVTNE